jgi:hypothetical protein
MKVAMIVDIYCLVLRVPVDERFKRAILACSRQAARRAD